MDRGMGGRVNWNIRGVGDKMSKVLPAPKFLPRHNTYFEKDGLDLNHVLEKSPLNKQPSPFRPELS